MPARAWSEALAEHSAILGAYLARVESLSPSDWTAPMSGRAWSPAEETLHLIKAYQLPLDDTGMRPRVSPLYAWVLRNFYLRYLLWRRTFHHGARAPSEVRPSPEEALNMSQDEMIARLRSTAKAAEEALMRNATERPGFKMMHAYFGPLDPLLALRMLSAHTRHHTQLSA